MEKSSEFLVSVCDCGFVKCDLVKMNDIQCLIDRQLGICEYSICHVSSELKSRVVRFSHLLFELQIAA